MCGDQNRKPHIKILTAATNNSLFLHSSHVKGFHFDTGVNANDVRRMCSWFVELRCRRRTANDSHVGEKEEVRWGVFGNWACHGVERTTCHPLCRPLGLLPMKLVVVDKQLTGYPRVNKTAPPFYQMMTSIIHRSIAIVRSSLFCVCVHNIVLKTDRRTTFPSVFLGFLSADGWEIKKIKGIASGRQDKSRARCWSKHDKKKTKGWQRETTGGPYI